MDAKDRKLLEELLEAHLRRVDARCATTEARLAELRRDLLGMSRASFERDGKLPT